MTDKAGITRRMMIAGLAVGTALTLALPAWAQDVTKVAAIWTVPVEQQWASRLHNALVAAKDRGEIDYVYSENVTNTDYERVMREYAEQGVALMIGEARLASSSRPVPWPPTTPTSSS